MKIFIWIAILGISISSTPGNLLLGETEAAIEITDSAPEKDEKSQEDRERSDEIKTLLVALQFHSTPSVESNIAEQNTTFFVHSFTQAPTTPPPELA